MLHLYSHPASPYGQKVQFLLEECGRPYEFHVMEGAKGDLQSPAFRAVSPFGLVPAIEVDGFRLAESGAILRYLSQKWQLSSLYPVNLEDRAQVDMVMDYATLHVGRHVSSLAWQLSWSKKRGFPVNLAAVEEARQALNKHLPRLERYLAERTSSYLVGSQLTLADVSMMPFMSQAVEGELTLRDYPLLSAWLGRMAGRPAWQKVVQKLAR
jgi:glutathione S-transferase